VKANGSGSIRGKESTSNGRSSRLTFQSGESGGTHFLQLAVAGEAGLALLAVALGRVLGVSPLTRLQADWHSFVWGVLAALPLLFALVRILRQPRGSLRRLLDFVVDQLGPRLAARPVVQLALLATVAGIGEELLFRGLIQEALARLIPIPLSLLAASVLFGLAHFATATYAILAGLMGLYLGGLFLLQGSLVAPIVTHAVYDFVALLLVARRYAIAQLPPSPN
jgi:membrane protease YdiL (CAAX protease family)